MVCYQNAILLCLKDLPDVWSTVIITGSFLYIRRSRLKMGSLTSCIRQSLLIQFELIKFDIDFKLIKFESISALGAAFVL